MPNELQKLLIELSEKPINMNINIPGLKGVDGVDGRNGADGLSAYDLAQLEGFKGTRQEWLDSLKAKVELPNAITALKRNNIYLENGLLDTILTKLIQLMGDTIKVTPKRLEYEQPNYGQTFIDLRGEPHFKVSINGGEKHEFESDNMRVNIDPFGAVDINLTYYDLNDQEYSHLIIRKTAPSTDDVYTASNGVVYTRYGKELEINVSEYDGTTPFKFVPKWGNAGLTKVSIKSDKKVMLLLNRDSVVDDTGNSRITSTGVIVVDYQNVSFKLTEQIYAFLLITGEGFSQTSCALNNIDRPYIVWNDGTKQYTSSHTESV
jgi:hypothetical protein